MANRRMFAKSIIQSARFLMMPPTSRLLYFDLGIAADDDGIAEAFTVMRMTNASEDDLKLLAAKGFVKILNDELVTVILDWKVHNYIQPDRYTPSVYKELLQQNVMDTACTQNVYNVDTACIQDGYTGKVRVRDSLELEIDKNSLIQTSGAEEEERVGVGEREPPNEDFLLPQFVEYQHELSEYLDIYTTKDISKIREICVAFSSKKLSIECCKDIILSYKHDIEAIMQKISTY